MRAIFPIVLLISAGAWARTEDRSVGDFAAVHVCCGIAAQIEIGPRRPVHVEGDDAALEALETVIEDGALQVRFKEGTRLRGEHHVKVTVQTPELRELAVSGGSAVRAAFTRGDRSEIHASGGSELTVRGIDAARLQIHASGGSVLDVQGSADALELHMSGGSQLHGRDLSVRDVDIEGSGGSQANLKATGNVRGGLSGGSQLHARGAAKTRVSTSGGSEVYVDD